MTDAGGNRKELMAQLERRVTITAALAATFTTGWLVSVAMAQTKPPPIWLENAQGPPSPAPLTADPALASALRQYREAETAYEAKLKSEASAQAPTLQAATVSQTYEAPVSVAAPAPVPASAPVAKTGGS